jgi:hypothetical protein
MLIESSRVTRSAGSTAVVAGRPVIHSVGSGSGSEPSAHVVSRLARAEPSRSRQIRLATVVSQPPAGMR